MQDLKIIFVNLQSHNFSTKIVTHLSRLSWTTPSVSTQEAETGKQRPKKSMTQHSVVEIFPQKDRVTKQKIIIIIIIK